MWQTVKNVIVKNKLLLLLFIDNSLIRKKNCQFTTQKYGYPALIYREGKPDKDVKTLNPKVITSWFLL